MTPSTDYNCAIASTFPDGTYLYPATTSIRFTNSSHKRHEFDHAVKYVGTGSWVDSNTNEQLTFEKGHDWFFRPTMQESPNGYLRNLFLDDAEVNKDLDLLEKSQFYGLKGQEDPLRTLRHNATVSNLEDVKAAASRVLERLGKDFQDLGVLTRPKHGPTTPALLQAKDTKWLGESKWRVVPYLASRISPCCAGSCLPPSSRFRDPWKPNAPQGYVDMEDTPQRRSNSLANVAD